MRIKSGQRALRAAVIETLEDRRLLSSGALDTTFTGGRVIYLSDQPAATAVQSDGKIVVVTDHGANFTVSRYLADGEFDKGFGPNKTGLESLHLAGIKAAADIGGMAIQPDGKIVMAGTTNDSKGNSVGFVARLLPSGGFDSSFNGQGYTLQVTNGEVFAVAIQRDGKIVAAGDAETGHETFAYRFMAFRLNANGGVDTSFGGSGRTIIDNGDEEQQFNAIAIDYDGTAGTNPDFGKIVLAGASLKGNSTERMVVARLNSNGKPDNSFAGDGRFTLAFPGHNASEAYGVTVQPGDKIVIGGDAAGSLPVFNTASHFVMARFNSNGTLDKTFGAAKTGLVDSDLGSPTTGAVSMVSGSGQYLVLGGTVGGQFVLTAFTPDGILDPSFGTNGVVRTAFPNQKTELGQLVLSPNQTIVAAGGDNGSHLDLARYDDAVPKVSLYSPIPTTKENIPSHPAEFEVFRDAVLPYATRVYFTIGGTAKLKTDYTGITLKPQVNSRAFVAAATVSGIGPAVRPPIAIAQIGYVDIPAGAKTADVLITPIDRGTAANKTIQLQLFGNSLYDNNLGFTSTTLTIIGDGAKPPPVTFENLTPTADAYVQDGSNAAKNFGTATTLQVKNSLTVGSNRWTYLKFNLGNISSISTADLVLDGNLNSTDTTNVQMQVFNVATNSWTETGITWNNKPAASGNALATATIVDTTEADYQIDLTSFFRAQLLAGNKTVSLLLKNPVFSSPAVVFHSKEVAADMGRPDLIIIN